MPIISEMKELIPDQIIRAMPWMGAYWRTPDKAAVRVKIKREIRLILGFSPWRDDLTTEHLHKLLKSLKKKG